MLNVNGCVRKVVLWMLAIILLTGCGRAGPTPTPTKTREALVANIPTPTPTLQSTDLSTVIPPTAPPVSNPMLSINSDMNVRGGPGTNYPIVGTASLGQQYPITGKNSAGDWWKINYNGQAGWVFGQLVTATDAQHVRIATIIPAPPSTPKPTSAPPPARTPTPSPAGCNLESNVPDPPSPDTDCEVWEMFYQLAFLHFNQHITGAALVTLESEVYPFYFRAYLNCGEPLTTFADYIFYLTYTTREEHGYDPVAYLTHIVGGASTAEFSDLVDSVGCAQALILFAQLYSE